jgi:hypothetical protein
LSEIMTILVCFHQQHYRNFKAFYCKHVACIGERRFPAWSATPNHPQFPSHSRPGSLGGPHPVQTPETSTVTVCHSMPATPCHSSLNTVRSS